MKKVKTSKLDNIIHNKNSAPNFENEQKEINEILEASRIAKSGEVFEGDIDQLVK